MTDKIVVFNTCGSKEEAVKVARALIEARVAACVNVIPQIMSVYRWQGQIEEAAEWLLVIKTSRELFEKVQAVIQAAHSYEVPEVIALPIADGSAGYLAWLDNMGE
jgi:periplasmic divalent cation tolerance protein